MSKFGQRIRKNLEQFLEDLKDGKEIEATEIHKVGSVYLSKKVKLGVEKHMKKPYKCDDTQFRYTPDAGAVDTPVECGVCKTLMEVTKNCNGSRTFMEAVVGVKSAYDSFICPHAEAIWHKQAVKLRDLARGTPSNKLAEMFRQEANEIIESKKETKEQWSSF